MCMRKKKTPETVGSDSSSKTVPPIPEPPRTQQPAGRGSAMVQLKEEQLTQGESLSTSLVNTVKTTTATSQPSTRAAGSRAGSREMFTATTPVVVVTVEPARKMQAKRIIDTSRHPQDPHYKTIDSNSTAKTWESAKLMKMKDYEEEQKKFRKGSHVVSVTHSLRSTQMDSDGEK